MGVVNLLPQLAPISHKVNLSELHNVEIMEPPLKRRRESNCKHRKIRVAIDISVWISSSCHGNGAELIDERHFTNYGRAELHQELGRSKISTSDGTDHNGNANGNTNSTKSSNDNLQVEQIQLFITRATNSVLKKIAGLQACLSSDIIVVFDGDTPPIKKYCSGQRNKIRNDAASRRDQVISTNTNSVIGEGDIDDHTLRSSFKKISAAKKAGAHTTKTYMAVVTSLLKSLREKHIPFLVSPYEADGQLAYLSKRGLVDLIISDDSDFIGHGAKAILYKYKEVYNPHAYRRKPANRKATGVLIRRSDLDATDQTFDLSSFTDLMLSIVCVAAGCDYCNSLKGVGIMTARSSVKNAFEAHTERKPKLEKVLDFLFRSCYGKINTDEKDVYKENFLAALVMFRHPLVYDPIRAELVFANIESPDLELMDYEPYAAIIRSKEKLESIVGKTYCKEMASNVAEGYVNPKVWSLFSSEEETPNDIRDALRKWNPKTYKIDSDHVNEHENNCTNNVIASQSSSVYSSASKLSSQSSSRSSNISVLSPNLLGYWM